MKSYFEKDKIGESFKTLEEGFKIRILVKSMRFFRQTAKLLTNDTKLIFVPEPTNEFDSNAISVCCESDSSKVGYVCIDQNIHILKLSAELNSSLSIISHVSDNKYDFDMWVDVVLSYKREDREGIYQYLLSVHSQNEISFECLNTKKV